MKINRDDLAAETRVNKDNLLARIADAFEGVKNYDPHEYLQFFIAVKEAFDDNELIVGEDEE